MATSVPRAARRIPRFLVEAARLLLSLAVLAAAALVFRVSFIYIQDKEASKLLTSLVAIVVGVSGAWVLFWAMNNLVSCIPSWRLREKVRPLAFVGPALLLLFVYLLYPVVNTVYLSLLSARSDKFVGLDNYTFAFTNADIQIAFRNNLIWLVVVTGVCVSLGLLIAVLVDRIRWESLAKSLIFLPMAISAVGASVVWRFMYAYRPAGEPQIGLLNAILAALGNQPSSWFIKSPWNNLALIVIMIWLQTGFCMVVLSAAIKNVPNELLEAARLDGANEIQLFFKITVPYIRGTIITVTTTVVIMVLKVFDIVYVMTRGNYKTEVIANRMYVEMFRFLDFGHGAALAVILFVAVVPVMVINVRNLRRQRSES